MTMSRKGFTRLSTSQNDERMVIAKNRRGQSNPKGQCEQGGIISFHPIYLSLYLLSCNDPEQCGKDTTRRDRP